MDYYNEINQLRHSVNLPNKQFAEAIMVAIEKNDVLTNDDIEILLSREKCRELFHSDYAVLKSIDESKDISSQIKDKTGRNRYYSLVHHILGKPYVMTSQLYGLKENGTHTDNRTPLMKWVLERMEYNTNPNLQIEEVLGEPKMQTKQIINTIKQYIAARGFVYDEGLVENFYLCMKSKPFVILAGTSGTGKTRLVKLFADAIGAEYKMVAVRPDWSDSSDLFGHVNINGKFIPGEILGFIHEAQERPEMPFILCLDEMNLARVEYYFSDFLSIIETRDLKDGEITSDPFVSLDQYANDNEAKEKYGEILFPQNLYLVGTVNMDETTFPFSKKVLDRANTIEFSIVDLTYGIMEAIETDALSLNNDFLKTQYLFLAQTEDEREYVAAICSELQRINEILQKANAHVGYRVRDEIVFYMLNNKEAELLSEDDAMDNEILQKILPRIQGSSTSVKEMLCELFKYLVGDYEGYSTNTNDTAAIMMKCIESKGSRFLKSAEKVAFMVKRFEEDGFTSYWL